MTLLAVECELVHVQLTSLSILESFCFHQLSSAGKKSLTNYIYVYSIVSSIERMLKIQTRSRFACTIVFVGQDYLSVQTDSKP